MTIDSIYDDLAIKVANPINTILHKLMVGSEQDNEDALEVYVRNSGTIDLNLMKEMAKELGISIQLDEFLKNLNSFQFFSCIKEFCFGVLFWSFVLEFCFGVLLYSTR